jgi:hypothetical protein
MICSSGSALSASAQDVPSRRAHDGAVLAAGSLVPVQGPYQLTQSLVASSMTV